MQGGEDPVTGGMKTYAFHSVAVGLELYQHIYRVEGVLEVVTGEGLERAFWWKVFGLFKGFGNLMRGFLFCVWIVGLIYFLGWYK